jgi:hypothetical protein
MASSSCSACGRSLAPQGTFCPWCGAKAGGSAGRVVAPAPEPTGAWRGIGRSAPFLSAKTTSYRAESSHCHIDLASLGYVEKAAGFGLTSAAVSILSLALVGLYSDSLVALAMNPSRPTVNLAADPLYLTEGLVLVSLILTLLELLYCRIAFKTLSDNDSGFSLPGMFALVSVTATVLLGLGVVALFDLLYQAIACAGPGVPVPTSCFSVSGVIGLVLLLALSGIISSIGYSGMAVGVWRLGIRFKALGFKVGAVLLFVPFANLIAWILILASGRSGSRRIESGHFNPDYG